MSVIEKNSPTPMRSLASIFIRPPPGSSLVSARSGADTGGQLSGLALFYVVDRDVLREVVVPYRTLGADRWGPLEIVMGGRRGREPFEPAGVPWVVRSLHDVLAPYRQIDVH